VSDSGGPETQGSSSAPPRVATDAAAIVERLTADHPSAVVEIEDRHERLNLREHEEKLDLRMKVGKELLFVMKLQMFAADLVFVLYGFWNGWDIPAVAIDGWLAATVIQVIGVVLVITRSLFPSSGNETPS
jgi:hypothetical protein